MKRVLSIIGACACILSLNACQVVENGTVGISKSFGKISDSPLSPGIYASVPVVREVEVWDVKTQRRSINLDIPSREGLIVKVQGTVLYKPSNVVDLRIKVGEDYVQKILDPALVGVLRNVIGTKRVEELIIEQNEIIGVLEQSLAERLKQNNIIIERIELTGLGLPVKFKEAVENKLGSEQKALQKQFELQQAKKDAEIEIARAKGKAESQRIVRSTLSQEYLQWLWISTLNENSNVIYVATEANMPIFRTTQDPIVKNK